MTKPGFSFIEVISPCPVVYGRMNKAPAGLDSMHYYQEKSVIRNGTDPKNADMNLNGPIVVGKFVDEERPTLWDHLCEVSRKTKVKV
jgi:2-oxoglutarate ferredoxin oxidoreductase subunit beta